MSEREIVSVTDAIATLTSQNRKLAHYVDMLMAGDTHMLEDLSAFMQSLGYWDEAEEWVE